MKTIYSTFFLFFLFLASCTEDLVQDDTSVCPAIACTEEFRTLVVKFKDAEGTLIVVKDFSAKVRRTGKFTKAGAFDTINFKGYYTIATDNDRQDLLSSGDTIDVSAVNPNTNQTKTAQFVVSGGKCACHIEKVSGPVEIVFTSNNTQ